MNARWPACATIRKDRVSDELITTIHQAPHSRNAMPNPEVRHQAPQQRQISLRAYVPTTESVAVIVTPLPRQESRYCRLLAMESNPNEHSQAIWAFTASRGRSVTARSRPLALTTAAPPSD